MNAKGTIFVVVLSAILSVSCSATGESKSEAAAASGQKGYEAAIAAAKAAQKKAGSIGGEWRDTGKLVEEAESTAQKGDFEAAIKLANKAKLQGDQGYKQAMAQKDAGPRF